MITYNADLTKDADKMEAVFAFKGLSGDDKPTETYDGIVIRNGSSFLEMDNKTVKFYNAAGKEWV